MNLGAAGDQEFPQQSQKREEKWVYRVCFEGVMCAWVGEAIPTEVSY